MKPASSQVARNGVEVVFQAFPRYAGISLGEHLRYLLSSIWTVLSGLARIQSPQVSPWLGGVGIVSAVLMLVGLWEDVGLRKTAVAINVIGYFLWAIWLIVTAVVDIML